MNPSVIPSLLAALSSGSQSSTVSNQYSLSTRLDNLSAYFSALCGHPYSGHLFVGEAPGYRGCAITGIPFTSERVLRLAAHPFLVALLPLVKLSGTVTERSATIVWRQFVGKRTVPAFWNAFPFHPHPDGIINDNRRPSAAEIAIGCSFLQLVVRILAPHTVVAVGGVAASISTALFPGLLHATLPHPSYRGTARFISGVAALKIT
jgi:uracil-DNA glycosylase